jgi:ribosomal protein L19
MSTEEKKEEKKEIQEEEKKEELLDDSLTENKSTKDDNNQEEKEENKSTKDDSNQGEREESPTEEIPLKKKETPIIKPGMLVKVHQRIKELDSKGKEKERVQVFEGLVIACHGGQEPGATFTVRKVTKKGGVAVEKIFPQQPLLLFW